MLDFLHRSIYISRMKKRTSIFACVTAAAFMAAPAFAQTASTPAAKMDIAGVRIGMTEAEWR
ncbi:MAG: hypothetical protein B7X02_00335, partial [Rhodospirillales bacterium 12-54-5]